MYVSTGAGFDQKKLSKYLNCYENSVILLGHSYFLCIVQVHLKRTEHLSHGEMNLQNAEDMSVSILADL